MLIGQNKVEDPYKNLYNKLKNSISKNIRSNHFKDEIHSSIKSKELWEKRILEKGTIFYRSNPENAIRYLEGLLEKILNTISFNMERALVAPHQKINNQKFISKVINKVRSILEFFTYKLSNSNV